MNEHKTFRRLGVIMPIDSLTLYLYTDGQETFLMLPDNLKDHPRVMLYPENETPDVIIDAAKYKKGVPTWVESLRQEFPECGRCGSDKLTFDHFSDHSEVRCTQCDWYFSGKNREADDAQ